MTISKTLLGGIALLGMTGLASAQTKIYVTGSTAFRASATNEINNLLTANGGGYTIATDTAGASAVTSANAATWTGGKINGTAVTIKVSWSGSGAGVHSVAASSTTFPVGFLPDGAAGTSNPDPRVSTNPREAAVPQIALSDVFQGTTPFNGTFNGATYAALIPSGTSSVVGVTAFTFAASKGFPAGLNMTPQVAQTLFVNGSLPLSDLTGNASDQNTALVATGRNADSGTRLTAMAETNVGVNTVLTQYQPTVSSGAVTALQPYPASTVNGVNFVAGNGGESSGSALRAYLPDTVNPGAVQNAIDPTYSAGYLVTYLGVSDFNAVSGSGAVALNYTGVAESQTAIEQGSYSFWGYEHLYYKSSLSGIALTFATSLTSQIKNSTSATLSPNVSVNDMAVQRTGDGGPISSLEHYAAAFLQRGDHLTANNERCGNKVPAPFFCM